MLSYSGTTFLTSTFILAGGNGRRLDPLTQGKAKALVPFVSVR
jgi:dTDP-glucose pyrophosphorylase